MNHDYDNIGTDPTQIMMIDNLDVSDIPKKKQNNKEPKKKKEKNNKGFFKKFFFALVVIILMLAVAYGVYYYLRLGTSKSTVSSQPKFTLYDLTISQNDDLSDNIFDYGDFSQVDIAGCRLDTSSVKTSVVGEYYYSVVCDSTKYSAKITVSEKIVFEVKTNFVYKMLGEEITPEEFITSEKDYTYAFASDLDVSLEKTGGPYLVNIEVSDKDNNKTTVSAAFYVIDGDVKNYLTCESDPVSQDGIFSSISDKFVIDKEKNNLDYNMRFYNYIYSDDASFTSMKENIKDGKITINNITGLALIDNAKMELRVVSKLDYDTLNKEYQNTFPTKYSEIRNYYLDVKKYDCYLEKS